MTRRNGYRNGHRNGHDRVNLGGIGTVINVLAIIIGFVCSMAAFYALTNWRLGATEAAIAIEKTEREATQHDYSTKFDSMNNNLSELRTTSAVQAKTLEEISSQLHQYLQQHK